MWRATHIALLTTERAQPDCPRLLGAHCRVALRDKRTASHLVTAPLRRTPATTWRAAPRRPRYGGRPVEGTEAGQWRNTSLPDAVPAPPLLLCSALRSATGVYKVARGSTASIRLVTAFAVRAALCAAWTASRTVTAPPPPLRRGRCIVPCRRQIARSSARSRAARDR